jgi:hypothetical protein
MRLRWWLALSLSLITLVSVSCAAPPGKISPSFDSQFKSITKPYSFNFTIWELSTFFTDVRRRISSPEPAGALNSQSVVHYFSYMAQVNSLKSDIRILQDKKISGDISSYESELNEAEAQADSLKPVVEQTIARQISETLADEGIFNPFGDNRFNITFPPVNFRLQKPLYTLVISPREKIERTHSIMIEPDINTSQMEEVESSLEKLGVSAVVIQVGGFGGTYPSFVSDNVDLRFTIDTAMEEWLHQYLFFKPLGFNYVLDLLGIFHQADIPTINETVAGIASQELGKMVYDKFYAQYKTDGPAKESRPVTPAFDFDAAMRNIRQTVDGYLAQRQVERAEKYMEDQRQSLEAQGYYIRKLNQAYFAFYGAYAYGPGSVDPIGDEVGQLRKQSSSLKDFLDTASTLKSNQDLLEALNAAD